MKLKVQMLCDEHVMRQMVTVLDKYAVEYNTRKKWRTIRNQKAVEHNLGKTNEIKYLTAIKQEKPKRNSAVSKVRYPLC